MPSPSRSSTGSPPASPALISTWRGDPSSSGSANMTTALSSDPRDGRKCSMKREAWPAFIATSSATPCSPARSSRARCSTSSHPRAANLSLYCVSESSSSNALSPAAPTILAPASARSCCSMVLADGSSLAGPTAAFDPPQPMVLYDGNGWSANYCLLERELLSISRRSRRHRCRVGQLLAR